MSIVDVAQRAGVSIATVSRVLNDVPGVSPHTARQVRDAVSAMKYVPPAIKPGPKPGNTVPRKSRHRDERIGTVALFTAGKYMRWEQSPVIAAAVGGVSRAVSKQGFKFVLDDLDEATDIGPLIKQRQVEGVVVFFSSDGSNIARATLFEKLSAEVPTVWAMGGETAPISIDHVTADNAAIGALAFRYLHESVCERMAFFGMWPQRSNLRARGQAFANAARDADIPSESFLWTDDARVGRNYEPHVQTNGDLPALVDRFVASSPRATGIFCVNDLLVTHLQPLLIERGIVPGRDVKIIGCDNEQVRLESLNPRPATIDVGADEIGWRAVRRLLFRIANPSERPLLIEVAPKLVVEPEPVGARLFEGR